MDTTTGRTYQHPSLNGPIEPINRQFYKTQRWNVIQNTDIERGEKFEKVFEDNIHELNKFKTGTNPSGLFKQPGNYTFYNTSRQKTFNLPFPARLPQWIKYDKTVLKFLGYFVEHVVESAYENYRIRKCNIFYYLDDDTMHIDEIREENSGIVQGYFVKRQRCQKEGQKGVFITWRDINLQGEIFLFGKKFRICDCDEFTKYYYNQHGIQLNPPEKIPEINFEDKFKNVDFEQNKKNIAEIKEYIEVGLKGGHPNKTLKQFLENDRKVLNFDISWFDDKYDKEEKVYKMNYYLADGKVSYKFIYNIIFF
jgi:hypothetical protein